MRGGTLETPFDRLITEATLAKLAGEKSFARGAGYFGSGAVADLVQTRDAINATVIGSEDYRVVLRPAGGALEWSCTCPLGEEGTFCKLVRNHRSGAGRDRFERAWTRNDAP